MSVYRRLKLRRADGALYLERWSLTVDRIGSIKLHKMEAPDPGEDLHDHPWTFVTIPLWGGYVEERAEIRTAHRWAHAAGLWADAAAKVAKGLPDAGQGARGFREHVRWLKPRMMRLDECHRIVVLDRPVVWTLVICGPKRRPWGFYLADGFMAESQYDATIRPQRRDLWDEFWEQNSEHGWSARAAEAGDGTS